jgi:ectoine hydroxylase-related dioxygenase (phytanoyl-CoA dioxygenase family)
MTIATTVLDLSTWWRTGFLRIDGCLRGAALDALRAWAAEVEGWPAGAGPWLQHDEMTDAGPRRARSENFALEHPGFRALLTKGALVQMAAELMGEPAVLYKEKINYKYPGGGEYVAHQDARGYPNVARTVTCLLAVDAATIENGCLELAAGQHAALLPADAEACVPAELAATFDWTPVPLAPGDLLWFHCFAPHRSGPNRSTAPRRALYITYNALAEGDQRAAYYAGKRDAFATLGQRTGTGSERLSLVGHFRGRPVS